MSEDDFQGNISEVLANVQSSNNEDGFMSGEDSTDVTMAFMQMAERAFGQRDRLEAALKELLAFMDRATDYELMHPEKYRAYIDARAVLQTMKPRVESEGVASDMTSEVLPLTPKGF